MTKENLNSLTFVPDYPDTEFIVNQIAAEYSTSASYAVGDYCNYLGQIYRCITAITGEAWTAAHWVSVYIADEVPTAEQIAEQEERIYAAYPTDTASGSMASFPDGAEDVPVKTLTVGVEPVQAGSGDPSPANVRPITGWTGATVTRTGKNLLKIADYNGTIDGITIVSTSATGKVSLSGTKSGNGVFVLGTVDLPAGEYTLSCDNGNGNFYMQAFVDGSVPATSQDNPLLTLSADTSVTFRLFLRGGAASNLTLSPMICLASETDATFEPYTGDTYSVAFPSAAGTVYGGTLDAVNGVLVVDRAIVDLGALNWTYRSNDRLFFTLLSNSKLVSDASVANALCSLYPVVAKNGQPQKTLSINSIGNICVLDDSVTSAADFKAYMTAESVRLVYELATPIVYQLTPQEVTTLLGANNIWADTGDVDVSYRADTTMYINKKLSQ